MTPMQKLTLDILNDCNKMDNSLKVAEPTLFAILEARPFFLAFTTSNR